MQRTRLEPKDPDEASFVRILQLGYLTDATGMLCGPRVRVLTDIADALLALGELGECGEEHGIAHWRAGSAR